MFYVFIIPDIDTQLIVVKTKQLIAVLRELAKANLVIMGSLEMRRLAVIDSAHTYKMNFLFLSNSYYVR